jgi:hypothetical protein
MKKEEEKKKNEKYFEMNLKKKRSKINKSIISEKKQ